MAATSLGILLLPASVMLSIPLFLGGVFYNSPEALKGGGLFLMVAGLNIAVMLLLAPLTSLFGSLALWGLLIGGIAYLTRKPDSSMRR